MVRKLEDEFTGTGTISTRFYNRRLKSGKCTRCQEAAMPGKTICVGCSDKLKLKYLEGKKNESTA